MTKTVSYLHNYPAGDLIAAMAGMKHIYDTMGLKAIIYQEIDVPAHLYDESKGILRDQFDQVVTMNEDMFDMLKPLIESQPYIESFLTHKGEKTIVDLTQIHVEKTEITHKGRSVQVDIPAAKPVNTPYGSIHRWLFHAFPDMACDLSVPWIELPAHINLPRQFNPGDILINFTERYRNDQISYSFLRKFKSNIKFVGTKIEYNLFTRLHRLNIEYCEVNDFLSLAQAMLYCKFFIGNQSFCWNLAESMKIPRILEICPWIPNCITTGKDGYDFLHQDAVEYYVEKLFIKK